MNPNGPCMISDRYITGMEYGQEAKQLQHHGNCHYTAAKSVVMLYQPIIVPDDN